MGFCGPYCIWLRACNKWVNYLSPSLLFSSWVLQVPSLLEPQLSSSVGEAEAQEWDQVGYWNTSSLMPGEDQNTVKLVLKHSLISQMYI